MKLHMQMCSLLLLVSGAAAGSDDSTVTVAKGTLERVEQILDRTGVRIGGGMSTGHFGARISGNGINSEGRRTEADEYSTLDLDIRANVNRSLEGRAVLRLHHNWQNFWSDPGNPLFTRWLSIDGNLGGVVDFHAGDCIVRHTPLTIWMPQFDLLYEPNIARRMRKNAMDEFFLGENSRPLEGANAVADIPLGLLVEKVVFTGTGSRLRSAFTSPVTGTPAIAGGMIQPYFSKYLVALQGAVGMRGGLQAGFEHLRIFDHVGEPETGDLRIKSSAQHTIVNDLSIEWDIARFLNENVRKLRLFAEGALSVDDSGWYDGRTTGTERLVASAAFGGAVFECSLPLNIVSTGMVKYIRNEEGFRNELAQSPAFVGRRIMNVEADSAVGKWIMPNHYSTFDARYHSVFKFCPADSTNLWQKAPFSKIAYGSNVSTKKELEEIAQNRLDPALQLIMPFGDATPDRQGVRMDMTSRWNECMEITLLFSWLEGEKYTGWGQSTDGNRTLMEFGAGMLCDVSRYVSWFRYPLIFSFSQVKQQIGGKSNGVKNVVKNADLRWQTGKHFELSSGVQLIKSFNGGSEAIRQLWIAGGCSVLLTPKAAVHMTVSRILVNGDDFLFLVTPFRYLSGEFRQLLSEVIFEASF